MKDDNESLRKDNSTLKTKLAEMEKKSLDLEKEVNILARKAGEDCDHGSRDSMAKASEGAEELEMVEELFYRSQEAEDGANVTTKAGDTTKKEDGDGSHSLRFQGVEAKQTSARIETEVQVVMQSLWKSSKML